MGQLIEYYIPTQFIPVQAKWMPPEERGKVLPFHRVVGADNDTQPAASPLQSNRIV